MQETLVKLLPIAAASAVSPLLLTASIIALSSPKKPLAKASVMALGCLTVLIPFAIFILLFDKRVATVQTNTNANGRDVLHIVVGLVLIFLVVHSFVRRSKRKKKKKSPLTADKSIFEYYIAGLFLMAANATTLMMYVPAAAVINKAGLELYGKVAGLIEMVMFSILPAVIGPILVALMGKRATGVLKPLSKFMSEYGNDLIVLIFGVLGVYLLIEGLLPFFR